MKVIKKITDYDFSIEPVPFNNPRIRYGSRGIIVNREGKIAILYKSKINMYKLIGGGLNKDEFPTKAFAREVREEAGATISNIKCIGQIIEEKSLDNFIQYSYIYIANVVNEGIPSFTKEEIIDGAKLIWALPIDAYQLILNSNEQLKASENDGTLSLYHSRFIVKRDAEILNYYINKIQE